MPEPKTLSHLRSTVPHPLNSAFIHSTLKTYIYIYIYIYIYCVLLHALIFYCVRLYFYRPFGHGSAQNILRATLPGAATQVDLGRSSTVQHAEARKINVEGSIRLGLRVED